MIEAPTRDFAGEEKRLKRQQALATMLMQQGSTPMETSQLAGGMVVPISPMQGLANVGQQLAAALMMRSVDKKESGLASDKARAYAQVLSEMPKDPADMPAFVSRLQTFDPKLAGTLLEEQFKAQMKPEEYGTTPQFANRADGTPEAFVLGNRGGRKVLDGVLPREKVELAPGSNVAFNPYETKPNTVLPGDPEKLVTLGPDGKPQLNQTALGAKTQVAAAGAPRVNTNILPNTVQGEVGRAAIGDLSTRRGQAQTAAGAVSTAHRIMQAIDTGQVMTGPGTGAVLALSRYFNVPGTDKEKIAATQGMVADLAAQTLAAKDKLGGGVLSDNDITFLKQVSGGDPNLSGAAIRRIAEISAKTSSAMIDTFNRDVASTQEYLGQPLPYDYQVQTPKPYQRPTTPGPEAAGASDLKAQIAAERARRAARGNK